MEKLKVQGARAKAGSSLLLHWNEQEKQAFEDLKVALTHGLSLFQVDPDEEFQLRTDASNEAIGSVLEHNRAAKWVPVCFFSKNLTHS